MGSPRRMFSWRFWDRLMWIRLGIMAVFSLRSIQDPRFGFVPTRLEWRIGLLYYLFFLPVGGAIAYLLRFATFHAPAMEWWKLALLAPAMFLAFLWVVALFEEFFFRAFLQRLLAGAFGSEMAGLTRGLRAVRAGAFDVSP